MFNTDATLATAIKAAGEKIRIAVDKGKMFGLIEDAPAVDTVPVKHGRWIKQEDFAWRHICSECEYYGSVLDEPVIPFNYCPNCGAKMDLEETQRDVEG